MHTGMFICYIILSLVSRLIGIAIKHVRYPAMWMNFDDCLDSPSCLQHVCPYVQVQWITSALVEVINLLIILLVTYMSVQFGKPLNQLWKKFQVLLET